MNWTFSNFPICILNLTNSNVSLYFFGLILLKPPVSRKERKKNVRQLLRLIVLDHFHTALKKHHIGEQNYLKILFSLVSSFWYFSVQSCTLYGKWYKVFIWRGNERLSGYEQCISVSCYFRSTLESLTVWDCCGLFYFDRVCCTFALVLPFRYK